MEVVGIRTPGLGDTSYLLHHDGVGVLVDPQRDVERFLAVASACVMLVSHVHNDHVLRGRDAARMPSDDIPTRPASAR